MTDDRVLAATKKCAQCGQITELLRFRCPQCSSEMFDTASTGAGPELVDAMLGRQKLSQQHVDQGGRLFQQGLTDEATEEFHKAIEANPWNATAHGNIGVIYLRQGQPKEAVKWFERALEIDPNVPGGKDMLEAAKRQLR
jgi:Tfp pilus assembly protein PilF